MTPVVVTYNQIGNEKRVSLRCCSTLLFNPYQKEMSTSGNTIAAKIICEISIVRYTGLNGLSSGNLVSLAIQ